MIMSIDNRPSAMPNPWYPGAGEQKPPPRFRVVKDPKTGKMITEELPSEEAMKKTLEETHRETREMIEGNKKFHDDPYAAKPNVVEEEEDHHFNIPIDFGF